MSLIYVRSPLRLGLMGGGTDLPEYSNKRTGHIINCTINLYNHVYLNYKKDSEFRLIIHNLNHDSSIELSNLDATDYPSELKFVPIALKYIFQKFNLSINGFFEYRLESDVGIGSGLGSSSSMMNAIVSTVCEVFELNLSKHELCEISLNIERKILKINGGSQDFYASMFGGVNLMHFNKNFSVSINSLNIESRFINELESSILLFNTGIRRESNIIEQEKNELINSDEHFNYMDELSVLTKLSIEYLTTNPSVPLFGAKVKAAWELKKKCSPKVSNSHIDQLLMYGDNFDVYGGKISGAGSGGYGFFILPPNKIFELKLFLKSKGILSRRINIDKYGIINFKL